MREQKKNIKECDTRFLKVEEHPPMKGDIYKDSMDSNEIHRICNNNNNNRHKGVYMPVNYKKRGWQ
jgi:hypothetical protein